MGPVPIYGSRSMGQRIYGSGSDLWVRFQPMGPDLIYGAADLWVRIYGSGSDLWVRFRSMGQRPESGVERCAASLISRYFVLTAAHCFRGGDSAHWVTVSIGN